MGSKGNGPLLEDYKRAIRAARWAGSQWVRIEIGGAAIVLPLTEAYKLSISDGYAAPKQELRAEDITRQFGRS